MNKESYSTSKSFSILKTLHENPTAGTTVQKAKDNDNGRIIILKKMQFDPNNKIRTNEIHEEINNHIVLEKYSPFIPAIYNCFWKRNEVVIEMQYIEGKSLREIIDQFNSIGENFRDINWYREMYNTFMCIVESVSYIHKCKDFTHKDLKPENIIITESKHSYILDYGISGTRIGDKGLGTFRYMAPEQKSKSLGIVKQTADVFSLAQIALEMFGFSPIEPGKKVLIPNLGGSYYPGLKPIIEKALSMNPSTRYSNASKLHFALKSKVK